jgi:hypothetical protein
MRKTWRPPGGSAGLIIVRRSDLAKGEKGVVNPLLLAAKLGQWLADPQSQKTVIDMYESVSSHSIHCVRMNQSELIRSVKPQLEMAFRRGDLVILDIAPALKGSVRGKGSHDEPAVRAPTVTGKSKSAPVRPKIGVVLSYHPILFKKLECLDNPEKFYPLQDLEFDTLDLLADGESKSVIQIHLVKLNNEGKVVGIQVQLATSEHSNEGSVVLELASDKFGEIRYGSQKGIRVKVPIREIANGESTLDKANGVLFVTSREIGNATLTTSIIENSSYDYVKSFTLPNTTKWKHELKIGSRLVGNGTNGYDALKTQWYLWKLQFLSYKEQAANPRGENSQWINIRDIVLDGDFGPGSGRCLRDFQRVSRGGFRNQVQKQVPITFTEAVSTTVTKPVISEFLEWYQKSYHVECYHDLLQIKQTDETPIDAEAHILYNALMVNDDAKGYLEITNPIGLTVCHWENRQLVVAESIRSSIRLFQRDKLIFRLHDADPNGILGDSHLDSRLKNDMVATIRTLRKEQEAESTGVSARDVRIHSGFRSITEQDTLYAKGRTTPGEPCTHGGQTHAIGTCEIHPLGSTVTNAKGAQMQSWHQLGLAVDLVFCDKNGNFNWGNDKNWTRSGAVGKGSGLIWGGDWNDPDQPHLQLPNSNSPGQAHRDAYNNTQGSELQKLQAAWALI